MLILMGRQKMIIPIVKKEAQGISIAMLSGSEVSARLLKRMISNDKGGPEDVAQWIEHQPSKLLVESSSLSILTAEWAQGELSRVASHCVRSSRPIVHSVFFYRKEELCLLSKGI